MNDPVLIGMAESLKQAEPEIARAKQLIEMARQAGRPIGEMQGQLTQLETEVNKWRAQLITAGYLPKGPSPAQ